MPKVTIEVSAELLVAVRFQMEAEGAASLDDTAKSARAAAERVAQAAIGLRGDHASANVQRITSFTTKLV